MESLGLTGQVRQVQQICYKAHRKAGKVVQGEIDFEVTYPDKNFLVIYNERGRIIEDQKFNGYNYQTHFYNEVGLCIRSMQYSNTKLYQTTIYNYNHQGNLIEINYTDADGKLSNRILKTYNSAGKELESIYYSGAEEKIYKRSICTYNENGQMLSQIEYTGEGDIEYQSFRKYNDKGWQIEDVFESKKYPSSEYNLRTTYKHNEHGDTIEMNKYKLSDGSLKESCSFSYEYDSEGKRIRPEKSDDNQVTNETEEIEYDTHGNWIKKTVFYNNVPINIFIREIIYFGDADEKQLIHPLTHTSETMETEHQKIELSAEEAKWLVDFPNSTVDNLPLLRFYALRFKEVPSLLTYTGPFIEAIALLHDLKENLKAQEIHSFHTLWGNHEKRLIRYTLLFPEQEGYLLHATHIGMHDADAFNLPANIANRFDEGYIHTSQIELLRPSEASKKRDAYFEEQIDDYITRCTITKKPDKPFIHLIETTATGFALNQYAVSDDFVIKDLEVNYGEGFGKFHDDLMHRFNTGKKGLVLFHGVPGTGKTYYIRHLLRKMVSNKKVVIYLPPNMVDHLVDPSLMTFLTQQMQNFSADGKFCVLLIEDAEPLLAKRQEGVRIQGVTNLLNMSDGLLNDLLNLQIICTFNVDLKKLDSALLRPGRLIARKEFKPLPELDANLLAQRLGINHHFIKPATLGEIYAMKKNKNTLIHDVEQDKDSSMPIDDLLG